MAAAAAFVAAAVGACPATELTADATADAVVAGVDVTAGVVVQRAACAFRACTSTICGPQLALCGWLLPGPYSVALPKPAWVAICPAVWPLPYSFVWFDDASAKVLCEVVFDGLTPALTLVCACNVVLVGTVALTVEREEPPP